MISMSGKSRMSIFPGTQRLFMKITDGMDGMIGWGLKLLKKNKNRSLDQLFVDFLPSRK